MMLSLAALLAASSASSADLYGAFSAAAARCSVDIHKYYPPIQGTLAGINVETKTVVIQNNQQADRRDCLADWARQNGLAVFLRN